MRRKFKCEGCGGHRPCAIETNQEKEEIEFYDLTEDLKCLLWANNTSYDWNEVEIEEDETTTVVCDDYNPEIAFPVGNGKCKNCGKYHDEAS